MNVTTITGAFKMQGGTGGGGSLTFEPGTAIDNGYYDGFPMATDASGGVCRLIYKKAGSHAAAGNLMLATTINYGASWTEGAIVVGGVTIQSTNHSFVRLSSGRMVICYKTDASLRFAYSDDDGSTWTQNSTTVTPGTNYSISPSPIKMIVTSYGTLLFAYYQVGSSGNPNSAIIMESTNNGGSFTQKCVVYTSNDAWPNNPPFWRGNEIALCETHPTGVQSTSKWIAIVRTEIANDGGTYFMKFNSSDGANTWSQDSTVDSGSFTDDNGNVISSTNFYRGVLYSFIESNSPVDIILKSGVVYVVNGERNGTYGYALKYITNTPDGAFTNIFSSWTRPALVKRYHDGPGVGSSIDCGYPVWFQADGNLFVAEYDVSTQAVNTSITTRRCLVETVQITGLP